MIVCFFKNIARGQKKKDNASNKAFMTFILNECWDTRWVLFIKNYVCDQIELTLDLLLGLSIDFPLTVRANTTEIEQM